MRRLRSSIRRATFALYRSPWDAMDVVGGHALFAALAAVTLVFLILVFVSRAAALSALWGLGAVWLVFFVFAAIKFVQTCAHPDRHRDWEWLDYGVPEDSWRLELRSFAPLRPRSTRRQDVKPLLCRVLAPDNSLWESFAPTEWIGDPSSRYYPQDFKCPKCGQPPRQIPAGEYEITWLKPWRGPFRRPLLRYTQTAPEREQASESDGQAS